MNLLLRRKFGFVEPECAGCAISQIAFEAQSHAAESQIVPRNLTRFAQAYFKTLFARSVVRVGHSTPIEQVHLIDMGNADHGERCIDQNPRTRFFVGLANGRL